MAQQLRQCTTLPDYPSLAPGKQLVPWCFRSEGPLLISSYTCVFTHRDTHVHRDTTYMEIQRHYIDNNKICKQVSIADNYFSLIQSHWVYKPHLRIGPHGPMSRSTWLTQNSMGFFVDFCLILL